MQTRIRHGSPLAGLLLALLAACAGAPVQTDGGDRLAVEGYDVVAYFTEGEATPGSPEHTVTWRGAVWRFANAAHRRRFREDPERYAPAYDGHCAWAMSQGRRADGRPQFWAIHEGRLYMNCNARVHERWLADREARIEAADREWATHAGD